MYSVTVQSEPVIQKRQMAKSKMTLGGLNLMDNSFISFLTKNQIKSVLFDLNRHMCIQCVQRMRQFCMNFRNA